MLLQKSVLHSTKGDLLLPQLCFFHLRQTDRRRSDVNSDFDAIFVLHYNFTSGS